MDEDAEWKDSFLPAFLNSSVYEGKNYAVPYRSSVLYMLYNKQVFADNNLDVPTTWDEFIDVCDTLKIKRLHQLHLVIQTNGIPCGMLVSLMQIL